MYRYLVRHEGQWHGLTLTASLPEVLAENKARKLVFRADDGTTLFGDRLTGCVELPLGAEVIRPGLSPSWRRLAVMAVVAVVLALAGYGVVGLLWWLIRAILGI